MAKSSKNNVNFYEKREDIRVTKPYAMISADEFTVAIWRYVSWAQMLGTHPDSAASFGRAKAAHIQIATDLRTALKVSQEQHTYPNIVLSVSKYFTAMMFLAISRSLEPAIHEMIERENRRWEEDYTAPFVGENI